MEQCRGADQIGTGLERHTAGGLNVFELVDGGKVAIHQDGIGQGPEVLGRLQFRGIRWQEQEMDVLGHAQTLRLVPARAIQDEHDLLGGARSHALCKGHQLRFEEGDAHRGGQMKHRTPGGGMHEAHEIAPLIAVLDGRKGPLSVKTPDFVQDRFQADAMLIDRPELDRRLRERGRDLP
jgi:hypothetical protein